MCSPVPGLRRGNRNLLLGALLWAGLLAASGWASPFDRRIEFTQPDGTRLQLHGRGDEYSAVFETLAGYTVVFDAARKAYCYARLGGDGRLESTGVEVQQRRSGRAGPGAGPAHERGRAETDGRGKVAALGAGPASPGALGRAQSRAAPVLRSVVGRHGHYPGWGCLQPAQFPHHGDQGGPDAAGGFFGRSRPRSRKRRSSASATATTTPATATTARSRATSSTTRAACSPTPTWSRSTSAPPSPRATTTTPRRTAGPMRTT